MQQRLVRLAGAAGVAVLLSACVVVPTGRGYGNGGYGDGRHADGRYPDGSYPSAGGGVYADTPPPQAQYEVVPALPYLGAVWIAGFWNWHGGRHAWVPGRWTRPQHGHHRGWAPHRWVPTPRGWHLQGGHWR